ncbi:hypothetical protein I317_00622 [Kwoniella heveanensis CBS 569]|nr:hypothetical protein I317_00622 [Kwoniella heveanensis CBS 569]
MASPLPPPPSRPCEQCSNRGAECTSNYIDSLAEAKAKKQRRDSSTRAINDSANAPPRKKIRKSDASIRLAGNPEGDAQTDTSAKRRRSSATVISTYAVGESSQSGSTGADIGGMDSVESPPTLAQVMPNQSSADQDVFPSHRTAGERQHNLLQYLFATHPVTTMMYDYTDLSSIRCCREGNDDLFEEDKGRIWAEEPSEAHSALDDEAISDLADDLIETFFSIVHPRAAILLDVDKFRSRFSSPDTHPSGPLSHAFIAAILGWGVRFSEHPAILADREETSARDLSIATGRKRSRLVSLVIIRAREVAEENKILRLPSLENAQTLYFLEGLLGRGLHDSFELIIALIGYQATYTSAVVRHLISLGYNTPRGLLSIQDQHERSEAVFVWWAVVMTEGYKTACHRMKPSLYDEDFEFEDLQEPATHPSFPVNGPDGPLQYASVSVSMLHWYNGCRQITSVFRSLSRALWIPKTAVDGISLTFLRDIIHRTSVWRDDHLSIIGAPAQWPESWNFQQAITACSIDCLYHVIWLITNRAMDDFGIKEEKSAMGGGMVEIESIKRRIKEEAEHAALRIAALIGILAENGYLKLDPLVIHHTIYEAGLYLASRGRSEHLICVAGLRQYSLAFPALWDQADELETVYAAATVCTHTQHLISTTKTASSSCLPLPVIPNVNPAHGHWLNGSRRSSSTSLAGPGPGFVTESQSGAPGYGNALGMVPSLNGTGTPNSMGYCTGTDTNNTPELAIPSLALPQQPSTTLPISDLSSQGPLPLPAAADSSSQYSAPFSRNSAQGLQLRQNGRAYYVDRGSRSTSIPAAAGTATSAASENGIGHEQVDGLSRGEGGPSDLPGVMFDWTASSLGGA